MKIRTMLVAAVLGTISAGPAVAKYSSLGVSERTAKADAIVLGAISSVEARDFIFRVERVLKGSPTLKSLRIHRFQNWTCAIRWAPYEKGQRLILFIRRAPDVARTWRVLGAGDEGEAPVEGGKAFLKPGFNESGQRSSQATAYGRAIAARGYDLKELTDAIAGYGGIYRWGNEGQDGGQSITQTASDTALTAYRARSPVHDYLVRDTVDIAHWREINIRRAGAK